MTLFSDEEKILAAQLSFPGGWNDKAAKPLKNKLKRALMAKTSNCCCYCRRSMHGAHKMTIDIEHVLPKGNGFPQFTFELRNLSVSCKRCNMTIKGVDTSFYIAAVNEPDPFKSKYYKFVHPNLDSIHEHLEVVSAQHNTNIMLKYWVVAASQKGQYAYMYFRLVQIEVNSFDEAQALAVVLPSESLPPEIAKELTKILDLPAA